MADIEQRTPHYVLRQNRALSHDLEEEKTESDAAAELGGLFKFLPLPMPVCYS